MQTAEAVAIIRARRHLAEAGVLGRVFKIRWEAQASGLLFRASRPKLL